MSAPLSVAIVGAGAIGGVLAAHLGASGAELRVLARGDTLAAWRDRGITVTTDDGSLHATPDRISDDPQALGTADLILVTVKGQDTDAVIPAIRAMMGPDSRVLGFQNGLDGLERLTGAFGADRVLAGVTYVPASVTAPGQVRLTGPVRRFVYGPRTAGAASPHIDALAALGTKGGLVMEVAADPMPAIWAKFTMLTAFHMVSALTRLPLGGWIGCLETSALYEAAMEEVAATGRAHGVALPNDLVAKNMEFSRHTADPRTRASMLDDLERGRPLELGSTVGWLIHAARQADVSVPIHETCYALLKPHLRGAS
ncbi:ketopantoate reductase family protein [Lutimaribacter marinistellae]|uniref:2-dehydropantoate 2-reductase n=1 Tax=Lutimaribacter marinistellae TaxID=1820329 RepID=A0ABV7TDZ6_9RHOB